jgi:hypothetical protein
MKTPVVFLRDRGFPLANPGTVRPGVNTAMLFEFEPNQPQLKLSLIRSGAQRGVFCGID